jgi:hypothetical protein
MLNRDQALAAMDAQIIRAEADRKFRLERRTRHLTMLYPALRHAPLEERQALVLGASKLLLRRWPIYAIAAIALTGIGVAILMPDSALGPTLVLGIGVLVLVLECALAVLFYLRMRSFVEREVAARFRSDTEQGHARGT